MAGASGSSKNMALIRSSSSAAAEALNPKPLCSIGRVADSPKLDEILRKDHEISALLRKALNCAVGKREQRMMRL
jgi:hypothetical protein